MMDFEQVFRERLQSVIDRGAKVGLTLTHICRESGTARATPERWRRSAPKTIRQLVAMEQVVAKHEAMHSGADDGAV